MAPSLIKHSFMVLALMYIFIVPCIIGNTYEYTPQIGADGSGLGNLPQTDGGGQYVPPQTGVAGADDPAEVVSKALLCFSDNYVYSSCEQAYRLTASGNINVPPEYTDQYCNGACLTETNLVLNCIDSVLSHFLFYNRASILDVRTTIKSGCSYGPQRGNFNVAEHLQTGENSAHKGFTSFLFVFFLVFVYMGYNILF